jgi:hypothetical protein
MSPSGDAFLSYGIIIGQPKASNLLKTLRQITVLHESRDMAGLSDEWNGEELLERMEALLTNAGLLDEMQFEFTPLGTLEEWRGQAILFKGKNEEEAAGLRVKAWNTDTDCMFRPSSLPILVLGSY